MSTKMNSQGILAISYVYIIWLYEFLDQANLKNQSLCININVLFKVWIMLQTKIR